MSIFLIDFENVHYDGLSGILNLSQEDEVYVFYSENGKRLTFELHEQINRSEAKFYYYKADVGGKNALDHQLSTYLGFLVGKTDHKDYYIVSKDRGFRYLVAFWQAANLDLNVFLVDSIKISRSSAIAEPATAISEQVVAKPQRKSRTVKAKAQSGNDDKKDALQIEAAPTQQRTTQPKPKAEPKKTTAKATKPAKPAEAKSPASKPEVIEFVLPDEVLAPTAKPQQSSSKPAKKPAVAEQKAAPVGAKPPATTKSIANLRPKELNLADIAKIFPEDQNADWLDDVLKYIDTAKNKTDLYNKIRRRLGQDHGRDIYNTLKKYIY